jgi:uncharacterized protein
MPTLIALTSALLTLLLIGLSLNISRLRIRYKQSFGDGGHKDLLLAIRAHGNTLEQGLLFALLMLLMELTQPAWGMLGAVGAVFLLARLLHALAMFQRLLLLRQIAHGVSVVCQLALALALLWRVLA